MLAPNGVAAIVLPSSLLSNGAAAFVAARETLLAQFDIVALAALGSGTFGKTGTNTVTLFLRRRHLHPAPADHYAERVRAWFADGPAALSSADPAQATYQDAHLLGTHCQHQGWEEADYQALLAGALPEALAGTELFKDYRKAFNKGPVVTDRRKQQTFKQLSEAEQEADLDRLFVEWVREREQDKVLTYVLASLTLRPVVLIKSPEKSNGGTEAVKDFLGYEFSDTKGREGIKYRTLLDEPAKAKRVAKNAEDDSEDTEAEAEEVAQNLSALNQINSLTQVADYSPAWSREWAKMKSTSLSTKPAAVVA